MNDPLQYCLTNLFRAGNRAGAKGKTKAGGHRSSLTAPALVFVPRTGFEPAHRYRRCDLNTVRLPISPPGQFKVFYSDFVFQGVQI